MPNHEGRIHSRKPTLCAALLACLLFVALHASGALAAEAGQEPRRVSLSASSQDIRIILADLADMAGVDIIVDDTLVAKVTLRLTDVPFLQALDTAAKAAGATVSQEGGLYLVMNSRNYYSAPATPSEQSAVQVFDLSGMDYSTGLELVRAVSDGLEMELMPDIQAVVVRGPYSKVNTARTALDAYLRSVPAKPENRSLGIIRLSYADASEVSMSLQGQFTSVRLLPVRGSNSIAVNGTPKEMEAVVAAIRELDRRPALLSFEVEIVEVNSEDMTSLGLDWQNAQGQPSFTITLKESEPSLGSVSQPTDDLLDWRPWIRSSVQIAAQIRVLQGQGKAKVLARPSLTTLENKTARMVTGDRYTIVVTQPGSTWQQVQYIDAGVQLELTPRVDSGGAVVVSLTPRVNAVTGFSREGYPVMSTREVQTTVRLEDGETLAIGGLIRDQSSETRSGLPGLADIPILGALFGSKTGQEKRTELVILVTPRILGESVGVNQGGTNEAILSAPNVGIP